jgi:two-component system response regulator AtoC
LVEKSGCVLVVAGEAIQRQASRLLRAQNCEPVAAASTEQALERLAHQSFHFTLVELGTDGVEDGLHRLKLQAGDPGAIIGITPQTPLEGRDSSTPVPFPIPAAVDTVIEQPLREDALEGVLAEVVEPRRAEPELAPQRIQDEISLWRSVRMREVRDIVREAASVDITVIVTGETGTGKEVVARAIHHLSSRRHGPFVKVNCAAVPHELLESEMFGHERGAFTGAHRLNIGKFESAHRGTIFLDEIGDFHPSLQAKLLHVLQDGYFSRVGGKAPLKVDVRVIAATNQDLERAVADGRFREDLYYRLNVVHINVPPLRERMEEVPGLVDYFIRMYSKLFRRENFTVRPAMMQRLLQHRYPGNVRELENFVKRMIVFGDPLLERALPSGPGCQPAQEPPPANGSGLDVPLRDIVRRASLAAEHDVIRNVLEQTGWNRVRAAKALRISYRALLYKMKRVGLKGQGLHYRPAPYFDGGVGRNMA